MPRGKTKRFIDKKNSVTFQLVHRSQQDPLVADETAPQRVLVPVNAPQSSNENKRNNFSKEKRKEEQQKFGVFFDDDYDYLQHLKDVDHTTLQLELVENPNLTKKDDSTEKPKITLPSSVFESGVQEKVGLLNKAAPVSGLRLDLDPEVVAALDDDFDYDNPENELEDNFMELANASGSDMNSDEEDDDKFANVSDINSDEERDDVGSLNSFSNTFKDEETRSRFTEYSMSSSVMRRNKELSLLDDRFEKLFEAYDDEEMGALDCEEIEGFVKIDSHLIEQYAEEYDKSRQEDVQNMSELVKDRVKALKINDPSSDEEVEDLDRLVYTADEKDKWDCESILSTLSNRYNPKLISEPKNLTKIKVDPKSGIPDVLNKQYKNVADEQSSESDDMDASTDAFTPKILHARGKNETTEERKNRKQLIKSMKSERRQQKKMSNEIYKEEKKQQKKCLINQSRACNEARIV